MICNVLGAKQRQTYNERSFVIDKNAESKNEWYGRTVITRKKITYEEAEESIKNGRSPGKELHILNNLAKLLTTEI